MFTTLIKILAAVVICAALIVVAGWTGLLFYVWPTNVADHSLNITPEVIGELKKLALERKFDADKSRAYPGAPNEAIRLSAQESVDLIIQSLITELPASPRRKTVLRTFKFALSGLQLGDSEERDQLLTYLERVMTLVGVTGSGELLNVWRYGFPYGWFQSIRG